MYYTDIIGHAKQKELLLKTIKDDNISHAYIFSGNESIGKKVIATIFAKQILCQNSTEAPCGSCSSCIMFNTNNHPDFSLIVPDGNSIKINQIRELQNDVNKKPIVSNKKIYIIDDAHKMTIDAQNCFLKTLEEPPEYICIILITSNYNMLLKTVKSRCKKITFNGCNEIETEEYLKSVGQVNQSTEFVKFYAQGSIGKIKSFLLEDMQRLFGDTTNIIKNCYSKSLVEVMNNNKFFINNKENIDIVLDFMVLYFKDYYTQNMDINNTGLYTNLIFIIEKSRKNLKINAGFEMTVDNMLLRVWEEING